MKIRKYLELNDNSNMVNQNLHGTAKAMVRRKFKEEAVTVLSKLFRG